MSPRSLIIRTISWGFSRYWPRLRRWKHIRRVLRHSLGIIAHVIHNLRRRPVMLPRITHSQLNPHRPPTLYIHHHHNHQSLHDKFPQIIILKLIQVTMTSISNELFLFVCVKHSNGGKVSSRPFHGRFVSNTRQINFPEVAKECGIKKNAA